MLQEPPQATVVRLDDDRRTNEVVTERQQAIADAEELARVRAVLRLAGQQTPGIVGDGPPLTLVIALKKHAANSEFRSVSPKLSIPSGIVEREHWRRGHGKL